MLNTNYSEINCQIFIIHIKYIIYISEINLF